MDKEALDRFKEILAGRLEGVKSPLVKTKAQKHTVWVTGPGAKKPEGKLALNFLSRVPAVTLLVHIYEGRLFQVLQSLDLPPKANNILAKGVFCFTSESEKKKEFSPDLGGARHLYNQMPMEGVADDIVARLNSRFLPIVAATLTLSDDLPGMVETYSEWFSYPLTILALLEKAGKTTRFSEILKSPELKSKYGREMNFDFGTLLSKATL